MNNLQTRLDNVLGKYLLQAFVVVIALSLSAIVGLSDAFTTTFSWLLPAAMFSLVLVMILWFKWNFSVFAALYIYLSLNLPFVLYQALGIRGDLVSLIIVGACLLLLLLQTDIYNQPFNPTLGVIFFTLTILLYLSFGAFNVDLDTIVNSIKVLLFITLPLFWFGFMFGKSRHITDIVLAITVVITQISAFSIFFELFFPSTWYSLLSVKTILSGTSGLFFNRNGAAIALAPGIAAAFYFFYAYKNVGLRTLLITCIIFSSLAVIVTLSISGWLLLVLTLVAFWIRNYFTSHRISFIDGLIVFAVVAGLVAVFLELAGFLSLGTNPLSDAIARVDWSGRLSQPAGFLTDSAIDLRSEVAFYYAEKFLELPLIGFGITLAQNGSNVFSYPLGPHNEFILLAVEAGIFPALTYVAFLVVTMIALWRRRAHPQIWVLFVICLGATFYQFFSHNMLDGARQYIVIWGLACGALSVKEEKT